jgi:hypothetical protein
LQKGRLGQYRQVLIHQKALGPNAFAHKFTIPHANKCLLQIFDILMREFWRPGGLTRYAP